MDKRNKQKILKPLAEYFETQEFKDYYMDMVAEIPDYIFTMPSSTSGKYHNKKQCEMFGQINHIYMFNSILNHRLRLKINKLLFSTPEERDCLRCVPAFHDAIKCGLNGSIHTVPEHPALAAHWVLETKVAHDIPLKYKQIIADCCEAHSGEWNKDKSGNVIMSEPRNLREFFIHECDILSSRPDLDYIVPDELKTILSEFIEETLPDINSYVLNFGKHKGKTLIEIKKNDPNYIEWAKENIDREPIKTLLSKM